MAAISPFPDSSPSAIPPATSLPLPQFSSPPQPSTEQVPSTPPLPTRSIQADQMDANPPDPSIPTLPSSPPNAPSPSNSGTPVISSTVDSSPPPTSTSSPPSSLPVSPPPSDPSPPPSPDVSLSPPQTNPPVSSPPPLSPPNPPTISPPSPPLATPPTSSSSPPPPSSSPPTSPPSPPSSNPPPTPSSSEAPVVSPPPSWLKPPENSPPSPTSEAPQSSPSPPASEPPSTSPPSTINPPPSDSESGSPPSTPAIPTAPVSHNSPPSFLGPPVPRSQIMVPSSNRLPAHGSSFNSPQTAKGRSGGIGSGGAAAIGVVVGVLMFGLVSLMALWIMKRKKRKSGANDAYVMPASLGSSPRSDAKLVVKTEYPSPPFRGGYSSDAPTDHGGFGNTKPWFTYQELLEATDGFSGQNLLGEGGFGYVYKGVLADGREVAVKQLKIGGGQGEREFQAEVEIISRIHHRHLVSLVGYCILESKRLLVYEFVQNDTLYFHLHGKGRPTMDWATRVKIAIGAARGIAYLHEDCHPRVIHRDIKSSNILLDNNFEARVADFGLARLAMDADTHVSTRVMGTFGYLAPEYATSGKLSEKSDVYSFGVVLLELITGRKPVDESQPLGDESVVEWARPLLTHVLETGDFESLVDPRLEKNYIESEMFRMIEAAAACVRHSSSKRPRMGQVVRALDGISDSGDLSNGLRVGESRMYNSAEQSAEIRWFRRVAFGSQDISSDFFSQNSGYPYQSGQNVNFSAQQGQNGNFSRQHNQTSQNLGFSTQSRQNANFSASGIPRPQHNNVEFSDQRQ